jgi:hypothetical protein
LLLVSLFCGIFPLITSASVKIDPGMLLNVIIDEIGKESAKNGTGNNVPATSSTAEKLPKTPKTSQMAESTNVSDNPLQSNIIKIFPGRSEGDYEQPPVKLRSAPSSKGLVITEVYGDDGSDIIVYLFADANPIQDKDDNSAWYKVLLYDSDWYPEQVYKPSFWLQKSMPGKFSYLYADIKDVKKVSFSQRDREQIDWLKQGRPLRLKVGDIVDPKKEYLRRYFWDSYKAPCVRIDVASVSRIGGKPPGRSAHRDDKHGKA